MAAAAYDQTVPVNYSANATPAANTSASQGYQDAITQQLAALSAPTDANSATVLAQTNPFDVATERGLQQNQNDLAEAAYAGGNVDTGDAEIQQQQAREAASQAEATNTGNVVANSEAERLAQQQALLGLGTNSALQQQQVTNQANQFGDQLGLNYNQLAENQNQYAGGLDYQNSALAQNNAQFGVTANQNQESIANQLALGQGQLALGQGQLGLGYYNTNAQTDIANQTAIANLLAGM
jgi:hypothetical protein